MENFLQTINDLSKLYNELSECGLVQVLRNKDGEIIILCISSSHDDLLDLFTLYLANLDDDIFELVVDEIEEHHSEAFDILSLNVIEDVDNYMQATKIFKNIANEIIKGEIVDLKDEIADLNKKIEHLYQLMI